MYYERLEQLAVALEKVRVLTGEIKDEAFHNEEFPAMVQYLNDQVDKTLLNFIKELRMNKELLNPKNK